MRRMPRAVRRSTLTKAWQSMPAKSWRCLATAEAQQSFDNRLLNREADTLEFHAYAEARCFSLFHMT